MSLRELLFDLGRVGAQIPGPGQRAPVAREHAGHEYTGLARQTAVVAF